MVWCDHCLADSPTELDPYRGYICCTGCGKVFDQDKHFKERRAVDRPATTSAEDNFSDIDDREVARHLHSDKERLCKAMIWEAMNRDYLKEQEAKIALGLTKSTKNRKRRYSQNTSAHAVAKATNEVADLKGHSSRINYGALRSLLDQEKDKKARTETCPVGSVGENESQLNARKGEGDETTAYEDIDYAGDDYDLLWE